MREIKFRAWLQDNMYYQSDNTMSNMVGLERFTQIVGGERGYTPEVMQYIGRKDKNDKEIYEGDIMHISDGYSGDTKIKSTNLQVVYKDEEFYLCKGDREFDYLSIFDAVHNFGAYVIGNIYENSELLKGGE